MINRIVTIARLAFRELYRDRFFFILIAGVLLFFGISFLLGELTFEEHKRILFDLGISAIHWLNLGIALFIGGNTVRREIERQTYMTLLSTPLSRFELLAGKFLGILIVSICSTLVLGSGLALLLKLNGNYLNFLLILSGIIMETAVLLAMSIFFGLVFTPFVSVFTSIGCFLTGHWLESLKLFAEKSGSSSYILVSEVSNWIFPNLYRLNWRSFFLLESGINSTTSLASLIHGFAWVGTLVVLSKWNFDRKSLT